MLNKPRLLTPGPTSLPERVRLAMAHDMIHHRKPEFKTVMGNVQQGLQALFGTTEVVLPLAASGSGAMTAAVYNLFKAGEKVIVVNAGTFAERWFDICKAANVATVAITIEHGQGVSAQQIKDTLAAHPDAKGVLCQLSETSTGVQHPIKELAEVTRNSNALLVVDGISGVSISPCPMDAWGIDCLLTGSQKGLMLPPGLALIAFSKRAWEKAEQVPVTNFYFDLHSERKNVLKNQTHFTTPVSLIIGLQESLAMFAEYGLDNVYKKQWALVSMVRAGVTAMGLELFAPVHYAWGVTSIALPGTVSASQILACAVKNYGIVFAAGQGDTADRMVRFGHMGWLDFGDVLAGLHALAESYKTAGGFITCRDYMEQALAAYEKALHEPLALV